MAGITRSVTREIELLEQDHDLLYRLIGRFQNALDAGSTDETDSRKSALLAHLDAHMDCEERLMLASDFPLLFAHAREHKAFRDQTLAILSGLASGAVTPANVGKLLLRIHEHHLHHHDRLFFRFLEDRYSLQEVAAGAGI